MARQQRRSPLFRFMLEMRRYQAPALRLGAARRRAEPTKQNTSAEQAGSSQADSEAPRTQTLPSFLSPELVQARPPRRNWRFVPVHRRSARCMYKGRGAEDLPFLEAPSAAEVTPTRRRGSRSLLFDAFVLTRCDPLLSGFFLVSSLATFKSQLRMLQDRTKM